jgi:plasmid maintenance system antidote protein VapI
MNYSQTLLTSLKAAQDVTSDNKLALMLGCTRQHISLIKKGKCGLSETMVIRAAEMAGINPELALISLLEDRAESDEMREVLSGIKEKITYTKH